MTRIDEAITQRNSNVLRQKALGVLAGGVNSPVRAFRAVGGEPIFLERASGCHVFDVDGNQYIDLVGSWGPAIVGHAHPKVVEAVQEAAVDGLSFGACCASEAELAEIIVGALPSVELLRMVSSGTEATMSAMRLARAATGRDKIIKFTGCYHGHVDGLLVAAGSGAATFGEPDSAGVPRAYAQLTLLAPYNDLSAVAKIMAEHGQDVAAILVEPIAGNMGYIAPAPGFLEGLRTMCDSHSSLLVFDEVMTGFRVGWGGYQNLSNLSPDITCLGKVVGGGMPVAAFGGPRHIMEKLSPLGPVYQAGTLSGNPIAMAAGIATLQICQASGFYDDLSVKATSLTHGIQTAADSTGIPLQTSSTGGMLGLSFSNRPLSNFDDAQACDHDLYARFFQEMLKEGIWLPPSGYEAMFISAAHDEKAIESIIQATANAFGRLSS